MLQAALSGINSTTGKVFPRTANLAHRMRLSHCEQSFWMHRKNRKNVLEIYAAGAAESRELWKRDGLPGDTFVIKKRE
jgi:hypothetical protein